MLSCDFGGGNLSCPPVTVQSVIRKEYFGRAGVNLTVILLFKRYITQTNLFPGEGSRDTDHMRVFPQSVAYYLLILCLSTSAAKGNCVLQRLAWENTNTPRKSHQ